MDDSYMSPEAIFLEQQRQVTALRAEVERLKARGIEGMQHRIAELRAALDELLEVAALRGDSTLPASPDDPKPWTARMQTAWDRAAALEEEP